jgi:hypothetical protein
MEPLQPRGGEPPKLNPVAPSPAARVPPIPIPPVTPREPEQIERPNSASPISPATAGPPAVAVATARVPAELLALIQEFRNRVSALEDREPQRGPPGEDGQDGTVGQDADCAAVMAKLDLLIGRVEALELMLTPDASGRMTGLPPIYLHKRNMTTNEETTDEVHLGEGFIFKLYPHQN